MKPPNRCFACGESNPHGLQLKFDYDPARRLAQCDLQIDEKYQGATGFAHGGMIATLLDEAMAKANGMGGIRAVTLRMTVAYRKMVPLQQRLLLSGWRTASRGRKLYLRSELRDSHGLLLAEAKGLFLRVPEQ